MPHASSQLHGLEGSSAENDRRLESKTASRNVYEAALPHVRRTKARHAGADDRILTAAVTTPSTESLDATAAMLWAG